MTFIGFDCIFNFFSLSFLFGFAKVSDRWVILCWSSEVALAEERVIEECRLWVVLEGEGGSVRSISSSRNIFFTDTDETNTNRRFLSFFQKDLSLEHDSCAIGRSS